MAAGSPHFQGSLILFTGPMASGKTTELRRVQKMAFKSPFHKPFSIGHSNNPENTERGFVLARSGEKFRATFVPVLTEELALRIIDGKHDMVFIDEGQFFDHTGPDELKNFCDILLNNSITVYVSGLNGTFERQPWPAISQLFALSPTPYMFYAHCDRCGAPACFTYRVGSNTEVIDVLGTYQSLCRKCWPKE